MDPLLLEQHLRSPLRLFPDPMLAQFAAQDTEAASAALLEKARQHLQMWGRSPYTELLLPQMYQRPNLGALNLGFWQGQWPPQLSAGFLSAAASLTERSPPPTGAQQSPSLASLSVTQPSRASRESPSPDMRHKHFARFSPYTIPNQVQLQQHSPLLPPPMPPSSRSSPN